MTDTDDLQQRFITARERLSVARATLDQFASTQGQPVDTVPEEPAYAVNPAYDAARAEYDAANAEFVRLEEQLKPIWAEQAGEAVE
ncbi:hypothetical protein ACXR2U_15685 [Jatrophihabitans sp. YIM 134969]